MCAFQSISDIKRAKPDPVSNPSVSTETNTMEEDDVYCEVEQQAAMQLESVCDPDKSQSETLMATSSVDTKEERGTQVYRAIGVQHQGITANFKPYRRSKGDHVT